MDQISRKTDIEVAKSEVGSTLKEKARILVLP